MDDWFINSTIRSINVGGMNNTLSAEVKEVIQKVWYFSQMNESPTSIAVVAETLIRPERIASESEKELISVSYYLATAKIALKIQLLNQSPKYDIILVNLRIFHIEMVFFSAMGKCIVEFGRPHSLNQSRIPEKFWLKWFITRKGYNCYRRLNQILAAMEILHFRDFDGRFNNVSLSVINDKLKLIKEENKILNVFQRKLLKSYLNICCFQEMLWKGNMGWQHSNVWLHWVVSMLHLYHELSRSIRIGYVLLNVHFIPKITNYSFALTHWNWPRCGVFFHNNLLKRKIIHQEIHKDLLNLFQDFQKYLFQDCQ